MAYTKHRHIVIKIVLALVVVLIAIRAALPFVIVEVANKKIDSFPGYDGYIGDVDLALWRGSVFVEDVSLVEIEGGRSDPFVSVKRVELSLNWKALLDRHLVMQVGLLSPEVIVRMPAAPKKPEPVTPKKDWREQVKQMFPVTVDHFWIRDGRIRYVDGGSEPNLDVTLSEFSLDAQNLTNAQASTEKLYSPILLTAKTLGGGSLRVNVRVAALEEPPDFDLEISLRNADIRQMNDLFRTYGKFDFERGTLSFFSEMAAVNGKIEGYVKPLLENIEIANFPQDKAERGFFAAVWEGIVAGGGQALKNKQFDRFGARVPVSGTMSGPNVDVWESVVSILRNGLIRALSKSVEDTISLKDASNRE